MTGPKCLLAQLLEFISLFTASWTSSVWKTRFPLCFLSARFYFYTNWTQIKMPLLWVQPSFSGRADMTPHPLVINYSWWQDRKIFGIDFRILAWPKGYLKLRSGYFVNKKMFSSFDSLHPLLLFDPMLEKVTTHGSRFTLAVETTPPPHTFLTNVWCSAPLISKHFSYSAMDSLCELHSII